jgi:hypothetical protein
MHFAFYTLHFAFLCLVVDMVVVVSLSNRQSQFGDDGGLRFTKAQLLQSRIQGYIDFECDARRCWKVAGRLG